MTTANATPAPDADILRRRFRDGMANLPAAVNIVTTAGPAGRCGITATAVCSVSDAPPTLLFCINRNSTTVDAFRRNGRLCVNVLPAECEALARDFAGMGGLSMAQRFGAADWLDHAPGAPRLAAALVCLAGRIVSVSEVGTHAVIFAEIDEVATRPEADALVYFDRAFRALPR